MFAGIVVAKGGKSIFIATQGAITVPVNGTYSEGGKILELIVSENTPNIAAQPTPQNGHRHHDDDDGK